MAGIGHCPVNGLSFPSTAITTPGDASLEGLEIRAAACPPDRSERCRPGAGLGPRRTHRSGAERARRVQRHCDLNHARRCNETVAKRSSSVVHCRRPGSSEPGRTGKLSCTAEWSSPVARPDQQLTTGIASKLFRRHVQIGHTQNPSFLLPTVPLHLLQPARLGTPLQRPLC